MIVFLRKFNRKRLGKLGGSNQQWDWIQTDFGDEENNILFSADGLEDRVVAKDLLYKFEQQLKKERGRGFSLKDRLKGQCKNPITWEVKKRFRKFMEENA